MALLTTKDNVCEVSSTKGVASFILGGATKGSQSFATAYPSGGSVYYFAREFTLTKEVGIMWEIGIGTLTGGTLSRDTVISSSDGTSKVQFPGPVTQIYSIVPLSTLVTDINAIDTAASIHAAPNKATPVGADEIGIWDSVTQLLGKVSFTNFVQAALAYYNTPVTWNGSTDRVLGVGQHTSDSFTSATSMPLHIACGDGQIYEIEIVGIHTAAAAASDTLLLMNNTSGFASTITYSQVLGSPIVTYADNAAHTDFTLAASAAPKSATVKICTTTSNKVVDSSATTLTTTSVQTFIVGRYCTVLTDTTTVWSSLGTITMPNAWTGTIVVRRVS